MNSDKTTTLLDNFALMQDQFNALSSLLIEFSTPEKKIPMERYMKNLFSYIGVTSPNRNEAMKVFHTAWTPSSNAELINWVKLLWSAEKREFQYVAMETFFKHKKLWLESDIQTIEMMMTHKSWWDSIDFIAASIVGEYFKKYPSTFEKTMQKWIESPNMWVNRTAIICQLKYREKTNTEWLKNAIIPHLESKEFFHQKAIGWALRQYARTNLEWVVEFVNNHTLKPLSRREAFKHHKHLI